MPDHRISKSTHIDDSVEDDSYASFLSIKSSTFNDQPNLGLGLALGESSMSVCGFLQWESKAYNDLYLPASKKLHKFLGGNCQAIRATLYPFGKPVACHSLIFIHQFHTCELSPFPLEKAVNAHLPAGGSINGHTTERSQALQILFADFSTDHL